MGRPVGESHALAGHPSLLPAPSFFYFLNHHVIKVGAASPDPLSDGK